MKPWTVGWWVVASLWEVFLLVGLCSPHVRLNGWFGFLLAATIGYALFHFCQAVGDGPTNSDAPPE